MEKDQQTKKSRICNQSVINKVFFFIYFIFFMYLIEFIQKKKTSLTSQTLTFIICNKVFPTVWLMHRTQGIVGVLLLYFLNPEHLSFSTWSFSRREHSHCLKPHRNVKSVQWFTSHDTQMHHTLVSLLMPIP